MPDFVPQLQPVLPPVPAKPAPAGQDLAGQSYAGGLPLFLQPASGSTATATPVYLRTPTKSELLAMMGADPWDVADSPEPGQPSEVHMSLDMWIYFVANLLHEATYGQVGGSVLDYYNQMVGGAMLGALAEATRPVVIRKDPAGNVDVLVRGYEVSEQAIKQKMNEIGLQIVGYGTLAALAGGGLAAATGLAFLGAYFATPVVLGTLESAGLAAGESVTAFFFRSLPTIMLWAARNPYLAEAVFFSLVSTVADVAENHTVDPLMLLFNLMHIYGASGPVSEPGSGPAPRPGAMPEPDVEPPGSTPRTPPVAVGVEPAPEPEPVPKPAPKPSSTTPEPQAEGADQAQRPAAPAPATPAPAAHDLATLRQSEATLVQRRAVLQREFAQANSLARSAGDAADRAANRGQDRATVEALEEAFDARQKAADAAEVRLKAVDAELAQVREQIAAQAHAQPAQLPRGVLREGEVAEAFNLGPKNTQTLRRPNSNDAGFIPDHVEGHPKTLVWGRPYHFQEIKDWAKMSDTGNVAAMLDYVESVPGSRLTIYYKSNTYMSGDLRTRIESLAKLGKVELVPFVSE